MNVLDRNGSLSDIAILRFVLARNNSRASSVRYIYDLPLTINSVSEPVFVYHCGVMTIPHVREWYLEFKSR